MLKKFSSYLLHLVMVALVCAIAAYWVLKFITPAPTSAPPPVAAPAPREADPVLVARMFGQVQVAPAVTSNVQVVGIYSAGKSSAAALSVDGKPARVVLLGQEVTRGTRLTNVRPDGVTLDNQGMRQDLSLPKRAPVAFGGGAPPAPGYTRDGNTLTAPSLGGPAVPPPQQINPGLPGVPMRPMQTAPPPQVPPQPQIPGQSTQ